MSISTAPDTSVSPVSTTAVRPVGLFRRLVSQPVTAVSLGVVAVLIFIAVFGNALAPYPQHIAGGVNTADRFLPPSWQHLFGTNELGQDVFSLVLGGASTSLTLAVVIIFASALIGTIVGAISGFFGRWLDEVLMRFTDLMLTIPSLILAMAVAAALGPGMLNVALAITLATWPGYARLVRGQVQAARSDVYVEAAEVLGANWFRVLLRHIMPNVVPVIIVKMSLEMSFAIITVASLGFIGIGVAPPLPEWGSMLSSARGYMPVYWWIAVFPGLAIMIAVFAFNLVGDGLREALDPRSTR
jgi:peptide/nickel transport system permease protein